MLEPFLAADGVLLSRRGARSKSLSWARDLGRQTLGPCVISFVNGTGLRLGGGGTLAKSGQREWKSQSCIGGWC